ncbi:hypothetical protein [Nocardiopsis changdeensis]|uniref:hypothetical protein n=1 Tax=Nocardiopsis changdeensis TaxID=2831969 RepID=UPI003F4526BC
MSGKKKAAPKVTFSVRHGPLSGTANTVVSLAALGAANEAAAWGLPPWWALGTAGAGLVLSQVRAHVRHLGGTARIYRALCWAGGGAWTGWVLDTTVWDMPQLTAGATGALVAALGAPIVADLERSRDVRAEVVAKDEKRMGLAQQWKARLARVCKVQGVQIKGIETWLFEDPETGRMRETGYTVEALLPVGGQGYDHVAACRTKLVTDLDLPRGCTVAVEQGASARRVLIHVTTVNTLEKDIPLAVPKELPSSVREPMKIGLTTRGRPVELNLQWSSGVLVGARRQGKSNTLKSITRQALRCSDVLIMGIDYNGGSVFAPFLRPWLEGKIERPPIDWVATSDEEAAHLGEFLVYAIERRRSGYAEHMWRQGGDDKLQASPQIPHILLLTDESKALSPRVKQLLVQINDRGGAASVSMVTSWLRAIAGGREGLPRDLLVQSEIRLTVRVNEDSELKHAFSHGRGIPPAGEAPAPGWGHVRTSATEPPELWKSARSTDQDAYDEAIDTAGWRPRLDEVTIGMDSELYEGRWERALAAGWMAKLAGGQAPEKAVKAIGASSSVSSRERSGDRAERAERWRKRMQSRRQTEETGLGHAAELAGLDDASVRDRFDRLVAGLDQVPEQVQEQVQEQPLPPFLVAVLELCERLGGDGVHRKTVAEVLTGGDRERASALMKALGVRPFPDTFRVPGQGSHRGWKTADIQAAAERIRRGAPVPLKVHDWEAPA